MRYIYIYPIFAGLLIPLNKPERFINLLPILKNSINLPLILKNYIKILS